MSFCILAFTNPQLQCPKPKLRSEVNNLGATSDLSLKKELDSSQNFKDFLYLTKIGVTQRDI